MDLSLLHGIFLQLRAVKWRRSKIKFFKTKKVKISNFELQKCFIPQKTAENMNNTDLSSKSNISCKKIDFFPIFWFFTQASRTPENFWRSIFQNFQKKFHKWLVWDLSGFEGNKVKNFDEPSPIPSETAEGFTVWGAKMACRIGLKQD